MDAQRDALQATGHIESAQRLLSPGDRTWSQRDLLSAAERAELPNTGWPIGLVIQRSDLAPAPTADGIEARLRRQGSNQWEDYWFLKKDASYYVARVFEEDHEAPSFGSSEGHPERSLWFDVRIWRIAEVILHSAVLYRELRVPPDEPYILAVNHHGLAGREFYASRPDYVVRRGRTCRAFEATWTREVTQDYVTSNLKSLVEDVTENLFVLFDFASVGQTAIHRLVDDFLHSKV